MRHLLIVILLACDLGRAFAQNTITALVDILMVYQYDVMHDFQNGFLGRRPLSEVSQAGLMATPVGSIFVFGLYRAARRRHEQRKA